MEKQPKFEDVPVPEEAEEYINPPEGTYFIRGLQKWDKDSHVGILSPEISASLQKDGDTIPMRPFGYVLKIKKGGIKHAFSRDVTSDIGDWGEKRMQEKSRGGKEYTEEELEELLVATSRGKHNELWIDGEKVEIVGVYIRKNIKNVHGLKRFLKDCEKEGLEIREIPDLSKDSQ